MNEENIFYGMVNETMNIETPANPFILIEVTVLIIPISSEAVTTNRIIRVNV